MAKKIVNPHPTPKALASHLSITHIPLNARYSDGGTLCPNGPPLGQWMPVSALSRLFKPDKLVAKAQNSFQVFCPLAEHIQTVISL